MKIEDYMIVSDCDRGLLEKMVRDHILDGWEPFKGLIIRNENMKHEEYLQVMIKKVTS